MTTTLDDDAGAVDASDTRVSLGWRAEAACLGAPTEWFFPSRGFEDQLTTDLAMAICRSCPVRIPCLGAALVEEPQTWTVNGIRGGTTAGARRRLLKARAAGAGEVEVDDPGHLVQPIELTCRAPLDRQVVHPHRLYAAML